MKLIHFADLHFSERHQESALAALDKIVDHARGLEDLRAFLFSGDWFDGPPRAIAKTGYNEMLRRVRRLREIAPVLAVSGTVSHDVPGAYVPLARLGARHPWMMLEPGKPAFLKPRGRGNRNPDLMVLGVPEPRGAKLIEAMKDGSQRIEELLHGIFEGMGVLRREHGALPCFLLFHGYIAGATVQNDRILDDARYPSDLLRLVGADYYALGDVHLGQNLSKPGQAPMIYPGSCIRPNWGELDDKSFVVIDIEGRDAIKVDRVSFGWPARQKLVWDLGTGDRTVVGWGAEESTPAAETEVETWLHVRGTEAELSGFQAPDVARLTTEVVRPESVRAAQIVEKHALFEKVQVYAEDFDDRIESGTIEKKSRELETAYRSAAGGRRSWQLLSLRLTGAIGLLEGQGKEEIEIDFASLMPGVVALVGPTGSGKTTTMENMVPWPRLLTRRGALGKHFENGSRELLFADQVSGDLYRALLEVRNGALSRSILSRSRIGGAPWEVLAERAADYEEEVDRLFGGFDLYLRSVFYPQKPPHGYPRLSEAPVKQRKEMMVQLVGLRRFEAYRETAKGKADSLGAAAEGMLAEKARLQAVIDELADVPARLEDAEKRYETAEREAREAEQRHEKAAQAAADAGRRAERAQRKQDEVERLTREIESISNEMGSLRAQQKRLEQEVGKVEDARRTLDVIRRIDEEIRKLEEQNAAAIARNAEKMQLYREELAAARAAEREKKAEADLMREKISGSALRAAEREKELFRLQEEIDAHDGIHCDRCGQVLPAEQRDEHRNRIDERKAEAETIASQYQAIQGQQQHHEEELSRVQSVLAHIEEPSAPEQEDTNEDQVDYLRAERNANDEDGAKRILEEAEHAEERGRQLHALWERASERLGEQRLAQAKARSELDPDAFEAAEHAAAEERRRRKHAYDLGVFAGSLEQRMTSLAEQKDRLAQHLASYDRVREEVDAKEREIADWRYLERACGPKGIQALELDAAGPSIAATANRLLGEAYGDRFTVEFETQRVSSDRKRMIEDFQIWITDKETGRRKLLEYLSGGEEAWVERALMDAFAYVRQQNEEISFQTVFSDEADTYLDEETSQAFLAMVEAGHNLLGREHTVLVTHNPLVQDRVASRILMEEL